MSLSLNRKGGPARQAGRAALRGANEFRSATADWVRTLRLAHWALLMGLALLPLILTGCGDAQAKQEDARILGEFRGPNFVPADQRRLQPMGPPLVPHVVYRQDFPCLVCHGNKDFRFRGQPVKWCPHPERTSCLQCHVPLQNRDEPFRFDVLGSGLPTAASGKGPQP